jgi:hypothetical protein
MIFRRRQRPDGEVVRHPPVCSFCGKEQGTPGLKIVAGPGVYICSDCVSLAMKILGANNGPAPAAPQA